MATAGEHRQRDIEKRLATACVPIVDDWMTDLEEMGSQHFRDVPADELRIGAFLLVRKVIEFVAKEVGLVVELDGGREDFRDLFLSGASVIVDAVDAQVDYTDGRSRRIAQYCGRLASMMGLSDEEIAEIEYAARIHNLGLINTSQRVLRMPRQLSPAELSMARNHSQVGADMIKPVEFLAPIVPMVRFHHANWDGTGYPSGVGGEQIPFGARVIRVADAFEAMMSVRPHRPAMSRDEALTELARDAGKAFDPNLIKFAGAML